MPKVAFACPRNGEVNVNYVNSNDPIERQEYGHECEHRIEVLAPEGSHLRCVRHDLALVPTEGPK
jgi:hypothetical protein